jgi:phage-related protein
MKRLPAAFYASPTGREPVREWLKGLDRADRKIIGEDIKDVEFSWPIGMPLCRARERTLGIAQRTDARSHRARAVLYSRWPPGAVARVHQKTQKTPASDLDLAAKRKKEIT